MLLLTRPATPRPLSFLLPFSVILYLLFVTGVAAQNPPESQRMEVQRRLARGCFEAVAPGQSGPGNPGRDVCSHVLSVATGDSRLEQCLGKRDESVRSNFVKLAQTQYPAAADAMIRYYEFSYEDALRRAGPFAVDIRARCGPTRFLLFAVGSRET
jgi:hypothetical protein